MRVTRDRHHSGESVALLDHDLVADSAPGGVEVDVVLPREGLNLSVLGQVSLGPVLDVVVEGEYSLAGIGDLGGAD